MMKNDNVSKNWWKDGNFFGKRYYEPDNSVSGYLPSQIESLGERTSRESEGVIELLDLSVNSRVLDAPCGYGRHSLYLAKAGVDVVGIDLDDEHLAKARLTAEESNLSVPFLKRDMRNIGADLYDSFDGVSNMFYSFGFFDDEADNIKTIGEFYRALKPGGQLLLHTDVSPELLRNGKTQTNVVRKLPDEKLLVILENYDVKTKRMIGSWETTDLVGAVIHPRAFYSVRLYSAAELRVIAKNVGFCEVEVYGTFTGSEFDDYSEELILVARK